jgi:predicted AlkP superfamily pyrophosphatase or phosphodiesterase
MRNRRLAVSFLLVFCTLTLAARPALFAAAPPSGKAVILWISIDGCRGDYVDRGQSPFLKSLMEHGSYSQHVVPIFPSLTFPSHTSEVTGVTADTHGIVSNKFYDTSSSKLFDLPSMGPNQLQAETIWQTATRQGIRAAVWDWPLSSNQDSLPAGVIRSAVFDPSDKFDAKETDVDRLEKLVDAYRKDSENPDNKQPLQLLIGYAFAIDHAGHGDGPESEKTTQAVHEVDQALQKVVGDVSEIFKKHMHPENGDALYVLITTDHGMDTIKTLVNLKTLMGRADISADPVHGEWAGSLANIYLNDVPGAERDAVKNSILENLRKASYLKCWTRDELPKDFHYNNPTRTGDIVVSLAPGYYFTKNEISAPVAVETEPRSLKGMHGYDPAEDEKMQGFMVLARVGSTEPGHDLGKVDTLRIHPTVAKLLGMQPAPGATEPPLEPLP